MKDSRKKGIESALIPLEVIKPLVELTNQEISEKTGWSIHVVKKSLCHHGLYKGKVYHKTCISCGSSFSDYLSRTQYCSNHCKHSSQKIWNSGLTKENDSRLEHASNRMKGNKLGALAEHHNRNQVSIDLPRLGTITYDKLSGLEKEWLELADKNPDIVSIKRNDIKINYIDESGSQKTYTPDFQVTWKSGVRWMVEIKGLVSESDYFKFAYATEFCKENRMHYRVITTGMVKKANWSRVYSQYKNSLTPSIETIMMCNAVSTSLLSPSPRRQVGVVICDSKMTQILSYGYNGDESGGTNIPLNEDPGKDGFIHAEENALLKLSNKQDAVMFTTDSPCATCAKRIIQSGSIKEIYYLRQYRDIEGIGILTTAGIRVYRYELCDYLGYPVGQEDAYLMLCPHGVLPPKEREDKPVLNFFKESFYVKRSINKIRKPLIYKKKVFKIKRLGFYTTRACGRSLNQEEKEE